MKIIIDAMGGDNAPKEIVKGAIDALSLNKKLELIFVGDESQISSILSKLSYDKSKATIVNSTQVIENDDSPIRSLRS